MPRWLTDDDIALVWKLRHAGLTQRKIAAETGFSRCTVQRILTGERKPHSEGLQAQVEEASEELQEARRCPECGAMVMMPCVACSVRKRNQLP